MAEAMEMDVVQADGKSESESKDSTATSVENLEAKFIAGLKDWCVQLEKGEFHIIPRMLQLLPKTRKQLNDSIIQKLAVLYVNSVTREMLLKLISQPQSEESDDASIMNTSRAAPLQNISSASGTSMRSRSPRAMRRQSGAIIALTCAEAEIYILLLAIAFFMDKNELLAAKRCAVITIGRIESYDKRSLDPLAAKSFFFLSLIFEKAGKLPFLRSALNSHLRTATLRRFNDTQAVLVNSILRIYLQEKEYEAASKFVSKIIFPEVASNNDLARFLYYQGRLKAVQLDYLAAAGYFMQAIRKAPQDSAIGFKQNVQKWIVVINLLQGEIPDRSIFRVPIHRRTLAPYLELTQAVRLGDLLMFNQVLEKHAKSVFETDETLTLIVRLRQNVIKTALRQISTAYSCISIADVRKKLLFQNDQEAEYLVAKAIKEGGIDAIISSDSSIIGRYMQSKETEDVYRTTEPQFHFDTRIRYCLELHNQAVKALRYPAESSKGIAEALEQERQREDQVN